MDTKDWIQIVLGLATLLTAVAALVNVTFLKKQRKDAQKPILQLQNEYYANDTGNMLFPEKLIIENNRIHLFNFTMVNSGYGVANNISVHCYYDIQKLLQELNAEYFIRFEGQGIRFLDDNETVYTQDPFLWESINYILPYSKDEVGTFRINNIYESLILRIKKQFKGNDSLVKLLYFSSLYARIEYFDSLKNKYNDYYYISHYPLEDPNQIVFRAKRISRNEFRKNKGRIVHEFNYIS